MAQVIHSVSVVYGSYSGKAEVICDDNDDMDVIKAIVRKQLVLDFLSMAHYSVKILSTRHLSSE